MMRVGGEGKGCQHAPIEKPAGVGEGDHGRDLEGSFGFHVLKVIVVFHALEIFKGQTGAARGNQEASERIAVGLGSGGLGGFGWVDGIPKEVVDFLGDGGVAGACSGGGQLVEIGVESDGETHDGAVVLLNHGAVVWRCQGVSSCCCCSRAQPRWAEMIVVLE